LKIFFEDSMINDSCDIAIELTAWQKITVFSANIL